MSAQSSSASGVVESPFHAGEQEVQRRLGVRESIEPVAQRFVRSYMPEQHRDFYATLPFIVAAARDAAGRPWATLLTGKPGFIESPDSRHLNLAIRPVVGDALEDAITNGQQLGLLGIELHTRRRNRVNGRIVDVGDAGVRLEVDQSFGNCPQYITERQWRHVPADGGQVASYSRLNSEAQHWIRNADTFFIASGHSSEEASSRVAGMDASHRGGAPGFVDVRSDTRIVFPDYAGNNFFNTIGNLINDPRVGLTFVDFETGGMLQITGSARIDFDSDDVGNFPGAQRLIDVRVDEVVQLQGALPLRWSSDAGATRLLDIVGRVRESDDVVSFVLAGRDEKPLSPFRAGQYLPIEVEIDGRVETRTYSLSGAPNNDHYRISVKREPGGRVSGFLHDHVAKGDTLRTRRPEGDFVLADGDGPVVLLSAGVGVTPMISMLHALAESERPVVFMHGVRDGSHHPFAEEVADKIRAGRFTRGHVFYSRARRQDAGRYDRSGRIDSAAIADYVPDLSADFYLCGPAVWLGEMHDVLERAGVSAERIHAEAF